jgi:DNA-binding transcriptional ArsR family regulator
MKKRITSILKQARSFENTIYSYLLRDLPEHHPCKSISNMQLKLLFEIYHREPLGMSELMESVHLPISLFENQIDALEAHGLITLFRSQRERFCRMDSKSSIMFGELEKRLDKFMAHLSFRVGELALTEWDHILKLVNMECRNLTGSALPKTAETDQKNERHIEYKGA